MTLITTTLPRCRAPIRSWRSAALPLVAAIVLQGCDEPLAPVASAAAADRPWASVEVVETDEIYGNSLPYFMLMQNTETGQREMRKMQKRTDLRSALSQLPTESPLWDMKLIGNFTGDEEPEILLQHRITGERGWWRIQGTKYSPTFDQAFRFAGWIPFYTENPAWEFVAYRDFTGDKLYDLLYQNTTTGARGFLPMNGTAIAGSWIASIPEDPRWRMVTAADFTKDGRLDILFENTGTGARGVWVMNGTAYQGWASFISEDPAWRMVAAMDVDGDGQTDILFQNTTTGRRGWWLMDGMRYLTWLDMGTESPAWQIVGVYQPELQGAVPPMPIVTTTYDSATYGVRMSWEPTMFETEFRITSTITGAAGTASYTARGMYGSFADVYFPIEQGNEIQYSIVACNVEGCSEPRTTSITTPALVAPSDFVVASAAPGNVRLTWRDNSSYESGFMVRAQNLTRGFTSTFFLQPGTTTWTHTEAAPATTYSYSVAAYVSGPPVRESSRVTAPEVVLP